MKAGICQVIFLMGVLTGLSIDNLLFSPAVQKLYITSSIETSGKIVPHTWTVIYGQLHVQLQTETGYALRVHTCFWVRCTASEWPSYHSSCPQQRG